MSDQATQTVVDTTPPPAQPGGEAAGARKEDDLDTLLAAFDDQGKPASPEPAKPEPKAGAGTDRSTPAAAGDGRIEQVEQYIFRQDMNATIKSVRGDLDPDQFDDALVEAWMDARARQDPRLARAWIDRHKNPQGFAKVVDGLGRDFSKKYGKMLDKGATEDREAVAAAVRGASTKAPEGKAPDFGRMTDGELQAWKDQHM